MVSGDSLLFLGVLGCKIYQHSLQYAGKILQQWGQLLTQI